MHKLFSKAVSLALLMQCESDYEQQYNLLSFIIASIYATVLYLEWHCERRKHNILNNIMNDIVNNRKGYDTVNDKQLCLQARRKFMSGSIHIGL